MNLRLLYADNFVLSQCAKGGNHYNLLNAGSKRAEREHATIHVNKDMFAAVRNFDLRVTSPSYELKKPVYAIEFVAIFAVIVIWILNCC